MWGGGDKWRMWTDDTYAQTHVLDTRTGEGGRWDDRSCIVLYEQRRRVIIRCVLEHHLFEPTSEE